jgi:isoquinoline 1-oxidoreductase subunit beta
MEEIVKPIDRRRFLKLGGATGAVLALGFYIPSGAKAKDATIFKLENLSENPISLNPFIQIDKDGKVTIFNHKPEMGQGTFQSIPTLIAEELNLELEQVKVEMALTGAAFGGMTVGGSSSIRMGWIPLRRLGAAARLMLLQAASEKWNVPVSELKTDKGLITHPSGKQGHFGEFVEAASKLEAPKEPSLKPKSECRLIGKKVMRPDVVEKVDGSAIFGIDAKIEGMVYATVEHQPVPGATIRSLDDTYTRNTPGVIDVFQIERNIRGEAVPAIAIVATNFYAATQGKKKLKVDWELGEHKTLNSSTLYREMRALASATGAVHTNKGDVDAELKSGDDILERIYETPFQSHACMEPMNATVHIKDGGCEAWLPTQVPNSAQAEIARWAGVPVDKVKVHITYLGGGFGRRLFTDFLSEAIDVAKKVNKPVKLIWTREDDTTQGPFRPGMVYASRASVKNGKISAWEEKVIGPSIGFRLNPNADTSTVDRSAMECISDSPYDFDHFRTHFVHYKVPMPLGWWRSVYASTNAFGHESFVDEMAEKEGQDPMEFRLKYLAHEPRFVKVLEQVKRMSDWDAPLPSGSGKGIAIARSFGSTCAHVVQVSRNTEGKLKIDKIWTALDCGMYVNPDTVKGQTEGNIIMALGAATKHEISFENGMAMQSNFHNYQMIRSNESPELDIHIMENEEPPGGVGEPGLPPLAPALTNAIFKATGKRIYKLPFDMDSV